MHGFRIRQILQRTFTQDAGFNGQRLLLMLHEFGKAEQTVDKVAGGGLGGKGSFDCANEVFLYKGKQK